jgi:ubiquinone/menaquinone biosynthesis C-methylase UbiE
MNKLKLFYLANYIYIFFFSLYKPLYFFYKNISDKEKIEYIKKNVKPGMFALDIGANIGFYTVLLSKMVGREGRVIAFEPDVKNFNFLKRITKKFKNVII